MSETIAARSKRSLHQSVLRFATWGESSLTVYRAGAQTYSKS